MAKGNANTTPAEEDLKLNALQEKIDIFKKSLSGATKGQPWENQPRGRKIPDQCSQNFWVKSEKLDKVVMVLFFCLFLMLHFHTRHSRKEWVVDNHPLFL